MELAGPIKPKKSSVAGEIPAAGDLQVGELAANTADGKLFIKHTDNTIKEISGGGSGGGGSLPTVRDWSIDSNSDARATLDLDSPASAAGDLLVACIMVRSTSGTITPPAGFELHGSYLQNLLLSSPGLNQSIKVYTKKATGGEPANYTWTQASASSRICGWIASVSGNPAIDTVTENYGNGTTATIETADNVLNLTAATWIYSATSGTEDYSQSGTDLTQITDSPALQARISGGYTTSAGTVTSFHASAPVDGDPNHGMINIALKVSDSVSINSLSDVDTASTPPTDGQVLAWVETNGQWEPADAVGGGGGGAVDSVNGETGVVSLGIQDMDDFELETISNFVFPNKANEGDTSSDRACPNPGDWAGYTAAGNTYIYLHNDANSQIYVTGETVTLTLGTGESFTGTISSNETTQPSWAMAFPVSAELSLIAQAGVGASLTITSFADPPIPLAEGDVLQWNDADQKFKPAQLPAGGGGGAVDSVNGETGVVSLGIQDMDDFALVPEEYQEIGTWDNNVGSSFPNDPGEWRPIAGGLLQLYRENKDGDDYGDTLISLKAGDLFLWSADDGANYQEVTVLGDAEYVPGSGDAVIVITISDADRILLVTESSIRVKLFTQTQSYAPLAEGDILQWNDADQKFSPAQLPEAVNSVNGETGVVSLGIQDMDDFDYSSLGEPVFSDLQRSGTWSNWMDAHANPPGFEFPESQGEWRAYKITADAEGSIQVASLEDNGSSCEDWVSVNVTDLLMLLTVDGQTYGPIPVKEISDSAIYGVAIKWDISDFDPSLYSWGYELNNPAQAPTSPRPIKPFTVQLGYTVSLVYEPLVEGDVLQWNATAQKFKPAQLAAGGGAVDSVNGETGTVSLGIQEMDDFELKQLNPDVFAYDSNYIFASGYLNIETRYDEPGEAMVYDSLSSFRFFEQDRDGRDLLQAVKDFGYVNDDTATFWGRINGGPWVEYTAAQVQIYTEDVTYGGFVNVTPDLQVNTGGVSDTVSGDLLEIQLYDPNTTEKAPLEVGETLVWTSTNAFQPTPLPSELSDMSDVDTTSGPGDGDVLTWVDANSQWEPLPSAGGGGAVESVNEQTGIVSLGIQEMDDFELKQLNPEIFTYDSIYIFVSGSQNSVSRYDEPGEAMRYSGKDAFRFFEQDKDGLDFLQAVKDFGYTNGDTGTFWGRINGGPWTEYTVGEVQIYGTDVTYASFTNIVPDLDVNTGGVSDTVSSDVLEIQLYDPNATEKAPLEIGETLMWTSADTFQPASLTELLGVLEYADDTAAGTGGLSVGDLYYNTTTGRLRVRMS